MNSREVTMILSDMDTSIDKTVFDVHQKFQLALLSINADVQHILWSLSCIQDKIKKIELLVIAAIILSVATPIICLGVIIRIIWMT